MHPARWTATRSETSVTNKKCPSEISVVVIASRSRMIHRDAAGAICLIDNRKLKRAASPCSWYMSDTANVLSEIKMIQSTFKCTLQTKNQGKIKQKQINIVRTGATRGRGLGTAGREFWLAGRSDGPTDKVARTLTAHTQMYTRFKNHMRRRKQNIYHMHKLSVAVTSRFKKK